jgi:hypothetical protein
VQAPDLGTTALLCVCNDWHCIFKGLTVTNTSLLQYGIKRSIVQAPYLEAMALLHVCNDWYYIFKGLAVTNTSLIQYGIQRFI